MRPEPQDHAQPCSTDAERILQPGRNCWRLERAERLAFLVDGADYFAALRAAVMQAERSVLILGWEFHSAIELVRGQPEDGWPSRLADVLYRAVERNPTLQVHILLWDFAMVYAPGREIVPAFRVPWRRHPRIHLRMDDRHPIGASHHEKVVVVDDAVAFAGGLDLTANRWDTPEHRFDDPRRRNPWGVRYRPFHDVQALVAGPAAAALGDLARERWLRATGQPLVRPAGSRRRWPEGIEPDLEDVEIGLARTRPRFGIWPEAREIEQLYVDAIAAATRSIYIENQYFTCTRVGRLLAESLARPHGPEIVLVLSYATSGWLEEAAMGVSRARLLRSLRAADRYGRLAIYYPRLPGPKPKALKVHSKLLIVDDRLVRVGSANLANRSMGLDSECDLAVEAHGAATAQAIVRFRNRLLAEHLGTSEQAVAAAAAQQGRLIAAIEALRGGERTLQSFDRYTSALLDTLLPDMTVLDPENPIRPGEALARMLAFATGRAAAGPERALPERGVAGLPATLPPVPPPRMQARVEMVLLPIALFALLWGWTSLADVANPAAVFGPLQAWAAHASAGLVFLAGAGAASFFAAPPLLLALAGGLAFGPLQGFALALGGAVAGSGVQHWLGRALGRARIRRLWGPFVTRLSQRVSRGGILNLALLRSAAVAPFTALNLVAGASGVGFRAFVCSTALGMVPGMATAAWFGDRLTEFLVASTGWNAAILFAALLLVFAAAQLSDVLAASLRHGGAVGGATPSRTPPGGHRT